MQTLQRAGLIFLILMGIFSASYSAVINVPAQQSTIQNALDAANNGDEIVVAPGTYVGPITIKDGNLTLRSSVPRGAIIDGQNNSGVGITATSGANLDNVVVDGFEIRNFVNQCFDIRLGAPHNFDNWDIKNNYVHNCSVRGIEVGGNGHNIHNNEIAYIGNDEEAYGIHVNSSNGVTIDSNIIYMIRKNGIRVSSPGNLIKNNLIGYTGAAIAINNADGGNHASNNYIFRSTKGIIPKHSLCTAGFDRAIHNTIIDIHESNMVLGENTGPQNGDCFNVYNNVMQQTGDTLIEDTQNRGTQFDLDYNLYRSSDFLYKMKNGAQTEHQTIAQLRANTPWEDNGSAVADVGVLDPFNGPTPAPGSAILAASGMNVVGTGGLGTQVGARSSLQFPFRFVRVNMTAVAATSDFGDANRTLDGISQSNWRGTSNGPESITYQISGTPRYDHFRLLPSSIPDEEVPDRVEVAVSTNGTTFNTIFTGRSGGVLGNPSVFELGSVRTEPFVRITFVDNFGGSGIEVDEVWLSLKVTNESIPALPPVPPPGFKYDPLNAFTDEFAGTHLNYSKWMDRVDVTGGNQPGYWERDNVSVSNGTLKIQTKFETPVNAPPGVGYQDFTTGVVMSREQTRYGYYEVRAKVQDSRASSAFWFFGFTVKNTVGSEIDVYEIGGGSPGHEDLHHINLHHILPPDQVVSFDFDTNTDLASGFHTYGVDWRSDTIRFYFDSAEVFSTPNVYWNLDLNLLMDTETLTAWFGVPQAGNLPSTHEIDYVRGYQLVPDTDPDTVVDTTLPALNDTNLATTRSIGTGYDGGLDVAPALPVSEYLKVVDHNAGTTVFGSGDQIQIVFDLGKLTQINKVRVRGVTGNIIKVFHGATGPFSSVFPGAGFHLVPDTTFQEFDGGGLSTRFFVFIAEKNTQPLPGLNDIEITEFIPIPNNHFAGRFLEPVHTIETDPGATIINAAGCEAAIEGGGTFLINGGTCSANVFALSNVTIYPNEGAAVTLQGTGSSTLQLGSNVTIAGIRVDAANSDRCITVNGSNVEVRNSLILGGDTGDCTRVESGNGVTFDGVAINGGAGPNGNSGHNFHCRGNGTGTTPTNVTLKRSHLYKNAAEVGWASWGGGTEDLMQQRLCGDFLVTQNLFTGQIGNGQDDMEELIDLKESRDGFTTTFSYNFLDGRDLETGKNCMILQVEDDRPSNAVTNTSNIYGNVFYACDEGNAAGGINYAASNSKPNIMRGDLDFNLFVAVSDNHEAMQIRNLSGNANIRHNTIINGDVLFLSGAGGEPQNQLNAYQHNIHHQVGTINNGQFSANVCSHNHIFASGGSLDGSCTNTITPNPSFTACSTGTTTLDCTPTSSTFISSLGSDGFVRGALVPPSIITSEIGTVDASTITLDMRVFNSGALDHDARPIQLVDTSKITVKYDTVTKTIDSAAVSNQTQIRLTMAEAATDSTNVTISMTSDWCQDSSDLGFAETHIGHQINAKCLAIGEFALTNNVQPFSSCTGTTVDDSGGQDFTTIQAGHDAAAGGTTVCVFPGTYPETVTISKALTFESADPQDKPIVDCAFARDFGFVAAGGTDDVTIDGFEIKNCNDTGIAQQDDASDSWLIKNNRIHHINKRGIGLEGDTTTVEENIIYMIGNAKESFGVYTDGVGNIIQSNDIFLAGKALIRDMGTGGLIDSNILYGSQGRGVELNESNNTDVFNNFIYYTLQAFNPKHVSCAGDQTLIAHNSTYLALRNSYRIDGTTPTVTNCVTASNNIWSGAGESFLHTEDEGTDIFISSNRYHFINSRPAVVYSGEQGNEATVAGCISGTTFCDNSTEGNPSYINPNKGNLQPASPLTAASLSTPYTNQLGATGIGLKVGAFQWSPIFLTEVSCNKTNCGKAFDLIVGGNGQWEPLATPDPQVVGDAGASVVATHMILWNLNAGVDTNVNAFQVDGSAFPGGPWTLIYSNSQGDDNEGVVHEMFNSTAYRYYRLTLDTTHGGASYTLGDWGLMTLSVVEADVVPPSIPTGLQATPTSGTTASLMWTPSTGQPILYRVEICQGVGCQPFLEFATPATANLSVFDLIVGATYGFRVRAEDAAGNRSGYSSTVYTTTLGATTSSVRQLGTTQGGFIQ